MTTLLIVEDNEMNRDMLSRRLVRRGYEVLMATDGAEGLACVREHLPDKGDAATRHIPVIALTAHAMSGDRQRAVDAGCDDFDTKPIELTRLLEKIEHWLGRAGPP